VSAPSVRTLPTWLGLLKQAGRVTDRAEANRRLYSIDQCGLAELRGHFERFWTQALTAFQTAAEQTAKEEW
jgi:hypothetical protein